MLVALESYLKEDHAASWKEWEERCGADRQGRLGPADVGPEVYVPQIANAVPHLRVSWDSKARGVTVGQVVAKLRDGQPSIEFGPGAGSGRSLNVAVWMLEPGEDAVVADRLKGRPRPGVIKFATGSEYRTRGTWHPAMLKDLGEPWTCGGPSRAW